MGRENILPLFNDVNLLHNDICHASNTLIWKTYREPVTPDEGLRYFGLKPDYCR